MSDYNKGDFTQQGFDGKVSGGLLLNNKRDVDVLVSTNEDESTLGLVAVTIEDHLNNLHYAFEGENLEAGEVYAIGGGGIDLLYTELTIINHTASALTNITDYFDGTSLVIITGNYCIPILDVEMLHDYIPEIAIGESLSIKLYYTEEPTTIAIMDRDKVAVSGVINMTSTVIEGHTIYSQTDSETNSAMTLTLTSPK